jgi:glycosyltransferase involved in cell wall biosynthesis
MKKVLFISAFTPSNQTAGQNYTRQLLNAIDEEYVVDLVYFQYGDQQYNSEKSTIRVVQTVRLSKLQRLTNSLLKPGYHPLVTNRFSRRVLRQLQKLVSAGQYNAIYFDFSQVFLYSLYLNGPKKIFMCHDILYQKFQRELLGLTAGWAYITEKAILTQPDTTTLTFSHKDATIIKEKYGVAAHVVNFFLADAVQNVAVDREEDYFCFFGAWNRAENSDGLKWFVQKVAPLCPDQRFVIIGGSMPEELKTLIQHTANMQYDGFVENPYPRIARAKALVAPVFSGAGVKVKVIESLACGTPVLGTHIALEGIAPIVAGAMTECNTTDELAARLKDFSFGVEQKKNLREKFLAAYSATDTRLIFS